jgi:LacI family transcriptional regulator
MHDVGVAAGVSASTVSRVINGTSTVDADLTARVREAIRTLGYRPNAAAQGLARGVSGTVGMLVPDLANPYFPDVLKAMSRVARANGHRVMVMESDEDPSVEHRLVDDLMRSCDGVLLCSPRMDRDELLELAAHDFPMVLVNRVVPGLDMPSISVDFCGGMTTVCGHLAQLGHRRVTYLDGPPASWGNAERVRAFAAARAFGLEVTIVPCGATGRHGFEAVPAALENDPSALITYNDLVALGALARLAELGIRVPDQLSLVGFDDVTLDHFAYPRLTTVSVPREELGRRAGDMLEQLMTTGHDSEPRYVPVELMPRDTSAPPCS